MKILVAEDEIVTRSSLKRQLEKWGHEVVAVEDGERAWAVYGEQPFDVVITDWEMPKVSGVELIQRLRRADRFWHRRIRRRTYPFLLPPAVRR